MDKWLSDKTVNTIAVASIPAVAVIGLVAATRGLWILAGCAVVSIVFLIAARVLD